MVHSARSLRRDRTAIGLSIALHCCVLAYVATIPKISFSPDAPDEKVLLTSIIRVERRAPEHAVPKRQPVAPPIAEAPVEAPPILNVAHTEAHSRRALVVASERRFTPRSYRATTTKRAKAPAIVAVQSTPAATAASAAPSAAPAATPAPVAVAAAHEDGIGNFGETYPAAVDPQARGTLFVGLAGSFVIRISVDETGRATAIEFVRAPPDSSAVQEMRTRLFAARFIPAACNGLRCAGTLELHN